MIFSRVRNLIQRQDWMAVAIEFVLVVSGVLLGFQINEWASEREARSERTAAVFRLLGEAEDDVAFFRLGVRAQRKLLADLGYALGAAQRDRWKPEDEARMTEGLARAVEATTPSPPSSVYDDLVASGEFGKIGDAKLRSAIARYHATVKFHRDTIDYFRLLMPKFQETRAFQYTYDASGPRPARLSIDFDALARDAALQERLVIVADWQMIALVLRERSLNRAIEMCREIGRVARRPCNLNRASPVFD